MPVLLSGTVAVAAMALVLTHNMPGVVQGGGVRRTVSGWNVGGDLLEVR